jgi:cytochrome b involved in lipid metabolism
MRSPVIIAVVMAIIMGGAYFALTRQAAPSAVTQGGSTSPAPNTTPAQGGQNNTETTPVKSYSMSEVSAHNSPSDCWVAISGRVYDVSAYVASGDHPGEAEILDGCGKDATVMFNMIPKEGRPHKQEARDLLPQFQIGTLQ